MVLEENGEPVLVIPGPEVSDSVPDAANDEVVASDFDGYVDMQTGKTHHAPE